MGSSWSSSTTIEASSRSVETSSSLRDDIRRFLGGCAPALQRIDHIHSVRSLIWVGVGSAKSFSFALFACRCGLLTCKSVKRSGLLRFIFHRSLSDGGRRAQRAAGCGWPASACGAVGGVTGALVGIGIPEYKAKRYEGRVTNRPASRCCTSSARPKTRTGKRRCVRMSDGSSAAAKSTSKVRSVSITRS